MCVYNTLFGYRKVSVCHDVILTFFSVGCSLFIFMHAQLMAVEALLESITYNNLSTRSRSTMRFLLDINKRIASKFPGHTVKALRLSSGTSRESPLFVSPQPQHAQRYGSSWASHTNSDQRPAWSEEWKALGLGAELVDEPKFPQTLMFVEVGFGVDQHGDSKDATKAAIRAVRNAIEFNSIPGVIEHIPGGRQEMMIHCKLGVPAVVDSKNDDTNNFHQTMPVDVLHVAKVFPYGKLLPIEIVLGGLDFPTGRVVEELGDTNDKACCVVACVTIGYGTPSDGNGGAKNSVTNSSSHTTYNTKDGY